MHVCVSSWDIHVFQRDLQSGVSLQTVSRAASLTEDLQLDQFFTILQVKGNYLITYSFVCLFHPQLKHSYPLFPSLFSLLFPPPLFHLSLLIYLSFSLFLLPFTPHLFPLFLPLLPTSLLSSSSPSLLTFPLSSFLLLSFILSSPYLSLRRVLV